MQCLHQWYLRWRGGPHSLPNTGLGWRGRESSCYSWTTLPPPSLNSSLEPHVFRHCTLPLWVTVPGNAHHPLKILVPGSCYTQYCTCHDSWGFQNTQKRSKILALNTQYLRPNLSFPLVVISCKAALDFASSQLLRPKPPESSSTALSFPSHPIHQQRPSEYTLTTLPGLLAITQSLLWIPGTV